jgi:hypothetical protein
MIAFSNVVPWDVSIVPGAVFPYWPAGWPVAKALLIKEYFPNYIVDTPMAKCRPSEAKSPDLAGAPEITPAMIDVGLKVYRDNERDNLLNYEIAVIVQEIFTAMFLAAAPHE